MATGQLAETYSPDAQNLVEMVWSSLPRLRRHVPDLKAHYQQLRARGKVAKVALLACMRKMTS